MNHATLSRKGGQARSKAKTEANRAKSIAYWNAVRAGERPAPRRLRLPPSPEEVAQKLAAYCREVGIIRLEVFGSTVRGDAKRGSDLDLMATFAQNPGLRFFTMEEEMAALLGVRVHLLTRDSVEDMANPFRRASILGEAQEIYHA